MRSLLGVLLFLNISQAHAVEINPGMLKKYYSGSFLFDGQSISGNSSNTSFNNKEKTATTKSAGEEYNFNWETQSYGNTPVFAISETRFTTDSKTKDASIYARTSSFSDGKLRSSTACFGGSNSSLPGIQSNSLKCVTATRRACDRLLTSYNAERSKGTVGNSLNDTQKTAQKCSAFLEGYVKMAKAFGDQSSQFEKRQKEVVDQDIERLEKRIKEKSGGKLWNTTSLNSTNSLDELEKKAQEFAGSMDGMRAISSALQMCSDSRQDFAGDSGSSSGQSSSSKAIK